MGKALSAMISALELSFFETEHWGTIPFAIATHEDQKLHGKMTANNAIWEIEIFQNLTRSLDKVILKNGIHVHTVQSRPS